MDLEDGSSDNIEHIEIEQRSEQSARGAFFGDVADLRPWGAVKYASSVYQDCARSPS